MISWFLLVPAWGPALVSFFSLLSFLQKGDLFHHDFLVPPGSGSSSGVWFLLLCSFFLRERGSVPSWCPGSSPFRYLCPSCFFSFSHEIRVCAAMIAWFRLYLRFLASFFDLAFDFWYEWIKVNMHCYDRWIPSWKHGLLLFGVYAGVFFYKRALNFPD